MAKKGFTLLEIIVVLIIVGVLTAIAVPNYISYMQTGAMRAARNNLLAIYNAENVYYLNNGNYCTRTSSPIPCNSLGNINTVLSLNLVDTYYNNPNTGLSYSCVSGASSNPNRTVGYWCGAYEPSPNNEVRISDAPLGAVSPIINTINPSCYTSGTGWVACSTYLGD